MIDHPSNRCDGQHIPVEGRPELCAEHMARKAQEAEAAEKLAGASMTRAEAKADAEAALRKLSEPVTERLYADEDGIMRLPDPVQEEIEAAARLLTQAEESVLQEAQRIIHGPRQQDYGGPLESFERIAALWSAYLGVPLEAEDAANLLILLKVARAKQGFHRDSYVDVAGYAGCAELIQEERRIRG